MAGRKKSGKGKEEALNNKKEEPARNVNNFTIEDYVKNKKEESSQSSIDNATQIESIKNKSQSKGEKKMLTLAERVSREHLRTRVIGMKIRLIDIETGKTWPPRPRLITTGVGCFPNRPGFMRIGTMQESHFESSGLGTSRDLVRRSSPFPKRMRSKTPSPPPRGPNEPNLGPVILQLNNRPIDPYAPVPANGRHFVFPLIFNDPVLHANLPVIEAPILQRFGDPIVYPVGGNPPVFPAVFQSPHVFLPNYVIDSNDPVEIFFPDPAAPQIILENDDFERLKAHYLRIIEKERMKQALASEDEAVGPLQHVG